MTSETKKELKEFSTPFFDKMKEIVVADFEEMKAKDDPEEWEEREAKDLAKVQAATTQAELMKAVREAAWDFYAMDGILRQTFKEVPEMGEWEMWDLGRALAENPPHAWDT